MTSRSWCITVNNYEYIPTALPEYGRYCILAKEHSTNITQDPSRTAITEYTVTPHLQGYLELTRPCRMTHVQNWLHSKAHLEVRRGTRDQARNYCKKEDSHPLELGEWKLTPGKRNDIHALFKDAKKLKPLIAIAKKHKGTYMRYYKGVQHVQQLFGRPPLRHDLQVSLFLGIPDSGKTWTAHADDPDLYALPLGKDMWFDNYMGQKTILIDDFCGEMPLVDLLRLLDIYPILLPVKGCFVWLRATRIVITSNTPLEEWYDYVGRRDSLAALSRRVHHTRLFNEIFNRNVITSNLAIDLTTEEEITSSPSEGEDESDQLNFYYNDPCPGEKGKK